MKKAIGLVTALLLHVLVVVAQEPSMQPPKLSTIIPVSPTPAALGKFGEVPVGYYTGIPNINVPLYTIKFGALDIPISLSYHAGGVKVEEVASRIGLGWAMNTGGLVNRQTRSLPDEEVGGFLSSYQQIYRHMNGQMNFAEEKAYFRNITDGTIDTECDLFSFNLPQGGGKFYFDTTGKVQTMPAEGTRITMTPEKNWVITDTRGYIYYFEKQEKSMTESSVNAASSGSASSAVTTWYITKIINPLRTDSVTFSYDLANTTDISYPSQTRYINETSNDPVCDPKFDQTTKSVTRTLGWRLRTINFPNGKVEFIPGTADRLDFLGDKAINAVEITGNVGNYFKRYELYQSYSTAAGSNGSAQFYRLYLDSIGIVSRSGKEGSYVFEYNMRNQLPNRYSYAQDYWGQYNGKTDNNTKIPTVFSTNPFTGARIVVAGADKSVDTSLAIIGTLKSIKYPTGGKTVFEMECNTAYTKDVYYKRVVGWGQFMIPVSSDPNGQRYWDTTFTVNSGSASDPARASVIVTIPDNCKLAAFGCPVTKMSGGGGPLGNLKTGTYYMAPGTYRVTVDLRDVQDPAVIANYQCNISWQIFSSDTDTSNTNAPIGGLRARRIYDLDEMGKVANDRYFKYLEPGSQKSSGYMLSFPQYDGSMLKVKSYQVGQGTHDGPVGLAYCNFRIYSSFSNISMLTTQGSPVGYKYVQEYFGPNGANGKKEYTFTAPDQYPDVVSTSYPYPPATSRDWQRGQLLEEKTFRYNASQQSFNIIHDQIKTYSDIGPLNIVQGIKVSKQDDIPNNDDRSLYSFAYFNTESGWFPIAKDSSTTFDVDNPGNHLQESVFYTYDTELRHFQPIEVKSLNSKGDTKVTAYQYPINLTATTPADKFSRGIALLNQLNITAGPVETTVKIKKWNETAFKFLHSTLVSYRENMPLPDTLWTTEFSAPTSVFSPATLSQNSIVIKDAAYKPQLIYSKYNSYGNIVEQLRNNDIPEAYIWGFSNQYPVAKILNGDYANISSMANIAGIQSSNDNVYIQQELNKIRQGLAGTSALINTYSYVPLVGMTLEMDASGRKTSYEYDGMQRLQAIRDQNGKILKLICYNYAGQPGLCSGLLVGNSPMSKVYVKQCDNNYEGSEVTYTVPANKWIGSTQREADSLANLDLLANGQAYANAKGTCVPPGPYVSISYVNEQIYGAAVKADVKVSFYKDQARTIPYTVTNLTVQYSVLKQKCDGKSPVTTNKSKVCNGTSTILEANVSIQDDPADFPCYKQDYSLLPGTGYKQ